MAPQLVALTEGPDIVVDKPVLLIGRHEECDVQIPSRKISRRHCCLAQVDDHLYVKDLYSTNGIRINGVRVAEGPLRGGDEVTIGSFRYKVEWHGSGDANGHAKPRSERDMLESQDEPVALGGSSNHVPKGLPLALPVQQAIQPERKPKLGDMEI